MEISIFFSPLSIRFFRSIYLNFSDLNGSNIYFSNLRKERRKFKFSSRVKIVTFVNLLESFECFDIYGNIDLFLTSIDTIFSFGLFKWIAEEFTFFEFEKGKEKV